MKRSSSNHSIWRHVRQFIPMKNHLAVQSVKKSSQTGVLGREMKEFTLIETYSAAHSVRRTSAFNIIWRLMKEFTLARVKKFSLSQHLKTHERIHTDEKCFSSSSGTRISKSNVVLKNIQESTITRSIGMRNGRQAIEGAW